MSSFGVPLISVGVPSISFGFPVASLGVFTDFLMFSFNILTFVPVMSLVVVL